ncbi:MAG: DUF2470 domain-containing protein [Rhodoglobus sp.]
MPTFEPDIVAGVLRHMNDDHPEDNLLIARAFGSTDAWAATMIGLDGDGGSWAYLVGDDERELTVPWSGPITERPEIRREIVVLYDAACSKLGIEPRPHE